MSRKARFGRVIEEKRVGVRQSRLDWVSMTSLLSFPNDRDANARRSPRRRPRRRHAFLLSERFPALQSSIHTKPPVLARALPVSVSATPHPRTAPKAQAVLPASCSYASPPSVDTLRSSPRESSSRSGWRSTVPRTQSHRRCSLALRARCVVL
jgi:hypothetical protein